jgi:deoxyadenosine/deoxycytidine kinase|tara:strand:+ start:760 stop:990 length:231 start_codon:yes stop_codon:yes gene_type:complete
MEKNMTTRKKRKKTYRELIDEVKLLTSVVEYYRNYLERLGILVENYIQMNGDEEKLIKYIEKRGKKIEKKWNENEK